MNILILSAGTRCQLVQYFKRSENGFDKIVTADCSRYAPALYMSDTHYIVPRMNMESYLPTIKDICKKEAIEVILPLQEDELALISAHRIEFGEMGILALVSDLESIELCRDKFLLYKYLMSNGIDCVETYDYETEFEKINKLPFPILVKERKGAGSVGILKINNWSLLKDYAESVDEKIIVQPFYEVKEYGVDVYVDVISGEVISIFAKEKLRMRAGETEKSKSIKDKKIFELVYQVVDKMKFRGPIDMDVFKYEGEYHVLEINPRFGGGYPHAYECGIDFTKFIAMNRAGKANDPAVGNYKENVVLLKFSDAILLNDEDMF